MGSITFDVLIFPAMFYNFNKKTDAESFGSS